MRRVLFPALVALSVLLVGCRDATEPTLPDGPDFARAPGASQSGQYIVVFNDDVGDVPGLAQALANAHGGRLRFTYQRCRTRRWRSFGGSRALPMSSRTRS